MTARFPAFSRSAPQRPELPTAVDGGGRVLVVDDSPTILKVVATILELHGYEVEPARDGVEALEKLRAGPPFDLVLLDFVMPRMNGYQFCRELRGEGELADVPVVLMSARTPVIGERFVEQTGAADALSKPFDARALVAVVGGVIAKQKQSDTQRRRLPDPEEMIDEAELDSTDSAAPPPSRHGRAFSKLAEQIADAIVPHLRSMRPSDLREDQLVEHAIMAGLSEEDALAQVARTIEDIAPPDPHIAVRGALELLPLVELLQLFQMRRQNGVLKVESGRKSAIMALRDGCVDMVVGRGLGDEFRLGRFLVRIGALKREKVDAEADACGGKTVLGKWLLDKKLISAEQLHRALALQTSELTFELIRWSKGRFTLVDEPFWPEASEAQLELGLSELVLEGFRRVDEWRLMADTVDFEAVPVIDPARLSAVAAKLGPAEQRMADAVDGQRSVREILEMVELAEFDAVKIVYQFLEARIIRKK